MYRLRFAMWVLAVLLPVFSVSVGAQRKLTISKVRICSYDGASIKDDLYSFDSDNQAKDFVSRIMKYTGLPQNFEIRAANVPNASAVIDGDTRLILYNQSYIQGVMSKTNTPWSAISIMAHEIGHHLSGHTLSQLGGNRPDKELEADKFSGHVLYQMGATLEQAKAAMESLPEKPPTSNYPPKSARLAAIYNGWTAAKDEAVAAHKNEPPPSTPPAAQNKNDNPSEPEPNTSKNRKKTTPDDEDPPPPRKQQPNIGYRCYSYDGYPRCVINPSIIGTQCVCYGQGYGIVGP